MWNIVLLFVFLFVGSMFEVSSWAQQTCIQPPAGLVSWWPGDGNANDVIGANNGTSQNGVTFVDGKVSQAFSFNGTGASAFTLPPVGTIDFWLKPNSVSTPSIQGIIGTYGTANGDDRFWLVSVGPAGAGAYDIPPNTLVINLGSCCVNDIKIPNPLSDGTWTHIAFTFDYISDVYQVYINGALVVTTTAQRNAPTRSFQIGGFTSDFGQSFFFNGIIDEVDIYNRVLSQTEIQTIFDADIAGKCKPVVSSTDLSVCQTSLTQAEQTIQNQQSQVLQLQAQLNQAQQQINQLNTAIQTDFRSIFNDPTFTIPGSSLLQQYQNIVNAILKLNPGRKIDIYRNLGGGK